MTLSDLLLILTCFLLSAIYSGAETGSYMINRIRLNHLTQRRQRSAQQLSRILRDPHIFVFSMLCGQNVSVYLLTTTVTGLFIAHGIGGDGGNHLLGFIPWNAEIASTLIMTLPLFLLGEVGPKNLFRKRHDVLMYRLAGLMRLSVLLFWPLTFLLKKLFHLLTRQAHEEVERELHHLSPDGLKEYFSAGAKEGILSSDQSRMIDNTITMHNIPIRQLMTPLEKISRLAPTACVADLKKVTPQKNDANLMDHPNGIGIISLFPIIRRNLADNHPLESFVEPALKLEEDRNIKSAFFRLRRNPHHCAIIVDAKNRPIGFVQLDDIARFIIG